MCLCTSSLEQLQSCPKSNFIRYQQYDNRLLLQTTVLSRRASFFRTVIVNLRLEYLHAHSVKRNIPICFYSQEKLNEDLLARARFEIAPQGFQTAAPPIEHCSVMKTNQFFIFLRMVLIHIYFKLNFNQDAAIFCNCYQHTSCLTVAWKGYLHEMIGLGKVRQAWQEMLKTCRTHNSFGSIQTSSLQPQSNVNPKVIEKLQVTKIGKPNYGNLNTLMKFSF